MKCSHRHETVRLIYILSYFKLYHISREVGISNNVYKKRKKKVSMSKSQLTDKISKREVSVICIGRQRNYFFIPIYDTSTEI